MKVFKLKPEIGIKTISALLTLIIHGLLAYLALTLVSPVKIFVEREKITPVIIVPPEKLYLPQYGIGPAASDLFMKKSRENTIRPGQISGRTKKLSPEPGEKEKTALVSQPVPASSLSSSFRLSLSGKTKKSLSSGVSPQLSFNLSKLKRASGKREKSQVARKLDFLKYINPEFSSLAGSGTSLSFSDKKKGLTLARGRLSYLKNGYDLTSWAEAVVAKIQKYWLLPAGQWITKQNQVGIIVRVRKNGQLELLKVETTSQEEILDQAALKAINLSLPLPKLPDDFPENQVEVYLVFEYHD